MGLLHEALGVRDGDIVAFTGAGGKTTAMFRCAREPHGHRTFVVTTTTRILVPAPAPDLALVVEDERDALLRAVSGALASRRIPVAGRQTTADGKLVGLPPPWVADLAGLEGVAGVLVEADGAARLPITAPRDGEPVIPLSATLVVAVVGVDALEAPVAIAAHRPERVTALTGVAPGLRLDPTAIARILVGPNGNTHGAPPGARVVALVNKADGAARLGAARAIAAAVRARRDVRVVVAALEAEEIVRDVIGG